MTEQVRIQHKNTAEFLEAAKLHSVKVTFIEEDVDTNKYQVVFNSPFELFYLGQSMGLNVGYNITRQYYDTAE
jgi:hypothetical protein